MFDVNLNFIEQFDFLEITHVELACCVLHNYMRKWEGTGVVTDTQAQQEPGLEVGQATEIQNLSTGRQSQAAMAFFLCMKIICQYFSQEKKRCNS